MLECWIRVWRIMKLFYMFDHIEQVSKITQLKTKLSWQETITFMAGKSEFPVMKLGEMKNAENSPQKSSLVY